MMNTIDHETEEPFGTTSTRDRSESRNLYGTESALVSHVASAAPIRPTSHWPERPWFLGTPSYSARNSAASGLNLPTPSVNWWACGYRNSAGKCSFSGGDPLWERRKGDGGKRRGFACRRLLYPVREGSGLFVTSSYHHEDLKI